MHATDAAAARQPAPTTVCSVLCSNYVCAFRTASGQLFLGHGDGVRLLFSLCYDRFNVNTNLQGGANTSSTILAMTLLNLPPSIHIKPENMWIVVIPGPVAPNDVEHNHFTRLLVDELVELYEHGMHFNHTALSLEGRLCHAAIANLVMDLVAAQKATAIGTHNCLMCSALNVNFTMNLEAETRRVRQIIRTGC